MREVLFGVHRFSDLIRNTGAPRDRLAARLKALVSDGILERRQYSDAPPRWDYHLTKAGHALGPVLQALREWGDEWAVTEPPVEFRHHDHVLTAGWICTTCGERVRRADVHPHNLAGDWDASGSG